MKNVKFKRPSGGMLPYAIVDGLRYTILDEKVDGEYMYILTVRPDQQPVFEWTPCESYVEAVDQAKFVVNAIEKADGYEMGVNFIGNPFKPISGNSNLQELNRRGRAYYLFKESRGGISKWMLRVIYEAERLGRFYKKQKDCIEDAVKYIELHHSAREVRNG